MITALIIVSIAVALKQAGYELPFVDKMIKYADAKLNKFKKNKEKTPTLDVKSIDIDKEPLYNTKRHSNGDLYFKAPQVRNNAKIYSGNLKI